MSSTPKGKSKAVIAYLTFIGMIIAYFLNREQKSDFATWHIKNMFGLFLLLVVSQVTHAYINPLFGDILWWIAFASWIISIIMVLLNKKKALPFISEKFQTWFTFLD